jgi:DNA-binding transcriptional LysR family regulator
MVHSSQQHWSSYRRFITLPQYGNCANQLQAFIESNSVETLANLESFSRSAELGSFSAAARRLSVTPAAVSRNVATLEKNLGLRLFQRSTRKLTLTDEGEHFLEAIGAHLKGLQDALSAAGGPDKEPTGALKISLSPTFGIDHILPMMPAFVENYPLIHPEWQFENRPVDLIAEGFDAAIGGGFELTAGLIALPLAPLHVIAVASPGYMAGYALPTDPSGLAGLDAIVMRAPRTGRIRHWTMRNAAGAEMAAEPRERIVVNDPTAMVRAALLGLGVALTAVPDALRYLEDGTLIRLAPLWYADAGSISLYYASRKLLPAKTRAFIDFVAKNARKDRMAERFAGNSV